LALFFIGAGAPYHDMAGSYLGPDFRAFFAAKTLYTFFFNMDRFQPWKPKYLTIVNSQVCMVIHYEGSFLL